MIYAHKTVSINGMTVRFSKSEHKCNICKDKSTQTYYEMEELKQEASLVKIRQLLDAPYLRLCENCIKELETNSKAVLIKLELNLL
ncbi:MAG: hypothetical protein CMC55_08705 [Flavobacteriaceae bacterium]|nr:hypothetical protein [Flavobacteriaceae bacterium]|tara:strand:- start:527 stop:784 length:258 start_codon:yes stop_codon:yes gene_type:complete